MLREIIGRFSKVADTGKSIVVGTLGTLNEDMITHSVVMEIASFYNINVSPEVFAYHTITPEGAIKRGCKLPTGNYNCFLEIYK